MENSLQNNNIYQFVSLRLNYICVNVFYFIIFRSKNIPFANGTTHSSTKSDFLSTNSILLRSVFFIVFRVDEKKIGKYGKLETNKYLWCTIRNCFRFDSRPVCAFVHVFVWKIILTMAMGLLVPLLTLFACYYAYGPMIKRPHNWLSLESIWTSRCAPFRIRTDCIRSVLRRWSKVSLFLFGIIDCRSLLYGATLLNVYALLETVGVYCLRKRKRCIALCDITVTLKRNEIVFLLQKKN